MPPSINEMSHLLPRTRSKDSLQPSYYQQNKYANAANIIEQGRLESQRMLMERYKRIDVSDLNTS